MFHLFIINPTAGQHDNSKLLATKIKSLFSHVDYAIEITQYPKHATQLVNEYHLRYENLIIFACGGDGTVNEVINGIQEKNIALAIIPVGTGNDFVRSYLSSENLSDYTDFTIKKVDLLKVDNQYGLNVISAGFDSAVAKNMHRFRKFGKSSYHLSVMYCLFSSLKNRFSFVIDDKITIEHQNYLMGICANGRYYGGGMNVSPYSDIDDGLMDFISIKSISQFKIIPFMKIFEKGRHIDELPQYINTLKCKKVKYISDKMVDINIDGEIHSMLNPTVEILPKQLSLAIPKKVTKI